MNTPAKIILVDDDKFLLDMYSMKFSHGGFEVQACLSVKDALDCLRAGFQPDALVFDLVMPGQDGFNLLETIRAEKLAEHAVKIALTNQSSDPERERALSLGADQFVIKATMIPSEVVNTVTEALSKRKSA